MSKSTTKHSVLTQAIEQQANQPKPAIAELKQTNREAELQAQYPGCKIKPGSLRRSTGSGDEEKYGTHKMLVTLIDPAGHEVTRATSDLFTWKGHCKACLKAHAKAKNAKKPDTTKKPVDLNTVKIDLETPISDAEKMALLV